MNEISNDLKCPKCGDVLFQSVLLNDNCTCVCTACGSNYIHPDAANDIPSGLKWISPETW